MNKITLVKRTQRIKYIFIIITFSFFLLPANCQSVEEVINKTNIDSLVQSVRDLSGEDSIYINGIKTSIEARNDSGDSIAREYLRQRLQLYDLIVSDQFYSISGHNLIATQPGIISPDSILIICAHYDAVTSFCADDNASGVAAVLEAARILSKESFKYSILYAFWDEEEKGLIGSSNYAQEASKNGDKIIGVLNLDMLGYDSNDDRLIDIHTNGNQNSLLLKDQIMKIITDYNLALVPIAYNPGTTQSDHSSFWNHDFGAVLLIEAYYGEELNPFLHSEDDRIDKFNLPYFMEMSKLVTGTIASLASTGIPATSIKINKSYLQSGISLFPNPVYGLLNIQTDQPDHHSIEIISLSGQMILSTEMEGYSKQIDLSSLSKGIYFITVRSKEFARTKKIIKL